MRVLCLAFFVMTCLWMNRIASGQSASSPVDRSEPLVEVRSDFGLVDGASARGNTLFVPDVKGRRLFAYRPTDAQNPWRVLVDDQGAFSGTFFQLGQLYIADNRGARILTSSGGRQVTQLAEFVDGARPNDLVVAPAGNVYVTLTKEGEIRRIAPDGTVAVVADGLDTPNGITLSPDGTRLYVSLYKPGLVMQASVSENRIGQFEPFATLVPGEQGALADGMSIDRAGNVYCAGADSVWIWNPEGALLDKIESAERPINCTFGGQHGLDLYISTFGGLVRQKMKSYGVEPNPATTGRLANPEGRPSTETPATISTQLNTVYYRDGTRKLLCDIFSPLSDDAGRPAIVLVHGGGWLHGDKTKFRPLALKLAQRGYVVMAIEYRLGYEAHFPAGIQDCNAAVRFLRSGASTYNIDPDRIAAVGGSAGGHLVGLMATGSDIPQLQPTGIISSAQPGAVSTSSSLDAAIVMAGPTQIASGSVAQRSRRGMNSNATAWLGKDIDEAPELYRLADVYEKITADDPPILFLTGSKDNPQRDVPSLRRLKSVGVTARQVIHQGATHGHWNRADWIDQVVDDICDFLQECL